ncbi:MAG: glycosyltransferase N-terminal domain-containing protein [Candidatus Lernaella stagnicola]|nr:glycosyltransferase N-terminal domain-containing protein [Candidatus Lernaella stagnicola]
MIFLFIYALLGVHLAPAVFFVVVVLGLFKPGLWDGLAARFGFVPRRTGERPVVVWCASLGEVNTAQGLIRRFLNEGGAPVLVATFTPSGYARARELFGERIATIVPVDIAPLAYRWMRRVEPRLLVLFETELWPCAIFAARRTGAKVVLVNGRLSDRSYRWYRIIRCGMRPALEKLTAVFPQSDLFAKRFAALGVSSDRMQVLGSLKFDVVAPPAPKEAAYYEKFAEGRRVFVAGSTHPGEESLVAQAVFELRKTHPDLALVIAPRHVNRCDEAAADIMRSGLSLARRASSRVEEAAEADVLLVDVLGELSWVYGIGFAAFVGGSFGRRGGQNVLEAAVHGVPVVVGPYTPNFRMEVAALRAAGGLTVVASGVELAGTIELWLSDADARQTAGTAARSALESHQGTVARTFQALQDLLDR